jgi:tetratricopeptide (TPR) repeat protein
VTDKSKERQDALAEDEPTEAGPEPTVEVDPRLREAIEIVDGDPSDEDKWDALEELADELQAPDPVLTAYRAVLERGLAKDLAPMIADRAVKFCQAWYIDTPEAMPDLLAAVVEKYTELDWAFERLVMLLTSSASWDQLLSLYDRTLATTRDEKKRRKLLEDASGLAKDFADQPDRAADYLQQLLRFEPDNDKLVSNLERLLERRERWDELLTLWRDRIPSLPTEEARASRAKIARISLEKLDAPDRAVQVLGDLVEESPDHPEACEQLESILALESADVSVRREALSLLRKTYEILERPDDVVRVMGDSLAFVDGEDARALRREMGNRLAIGGRDEEAIAHYAALLRDAPSDTDARRQLRQLSKRCGKPELRANALLEAAEATEDGGEKVSLWAEAADVRRIGLEDVDGAIELYARVLDSEDSDESESLRAAHQLNELLARAERGTERLPVLERLSELERSPSLRRQILGEAARLAESLGDAESSLSSWQQVLTQSPHDLEALDATVGLLERAERWEQLVATLRQRSEGPVSKEQRRADLGRVAAVEEDRLDEAPAAIATWTAIREQLGEDVEVLAALDRLLTASEQWSQLGELLSNAVTRERDTTALRLVRLADVFRTQLSAVERAVPLYAQALELDPGDAAARAGMAELLDEPTAAAAAGEALWRAYRRTNEHSAQLGLVEGRIAAMTDAPARANLLAEAARLHEDEEGDGAKAFDYFARAVPEDPRRRDLRADLLRLAEQQGRWFDAAKALEQAAGAFADDPASASELRRREATILEDHLEDFAGAFEAFNAAGALSPDDVVSLVNAARCAAHAGLWDEATAAAGAATAEMKRVDHPLLRAFAAAADKTDSWAELCTAFTATLDERVGDLPPEIASRLYGAVAEWHRDKTGDAEGAKVAAHRAIELTPDDVAALQRLVTLQRSAPGPELADTLLRIDAVGDERSLDALHEAARVTLEADPERALRVMDRLYRKSTDLWLGQQEASGEHGADTTATWALDNLVELLLAAGNKERAARTLLHGGELPLPPAKRAELNTRAAELLIGLGAALRAIDAYRRVLADTPDDLDVVRKLAALCEQEERSTGSVALREREIALTGELSDRLTMRFEGAKRAAALDARTGQLPLLLANLEEEPGHGLSIDALHQVLDERGQYDRLSNILESQASTVDQAGDGERAAKLWARLAEVAETRQKDSAAAIGAHEKVVALTAAPRSLDALARLHNAEERPAEAAKWLQQRLASAAPNERVAVLIKLARTHLRSTREAEAINTLQTAFSEAPQTIEVRKLLIPLLRSREDWAGLATTLATSVEHAADETAILNYAREAADLYHGRLSKPGEAVPVLRRAVELAPDDKQLRKMLGEGLRVAGELDEARELLEQLVKDYGRRGSRERAAAHMELAKVLHDQGEKDDALKQLDVASKMAPEDVTVMRTLAQVARESGELQRAEAALRTLLLTAKRLQADASNETPIGTSEVLFELASLAKAQGQNDQAEELAESAIDSLSENDARAPQLQAKLRAQGDHDLLGRLLDARLRYVKSPYRRGRIIGDKAEVLEQMGERAAAFDARLEAIAADPGSPLLNEGALELAMELERLDDYQSHLENLRDRSRRDTDAMIRCELLLRLGKLQEQCREDYDAANVLYDEAEATGVRQVDVLRARARVAGARGDEEEQMRVLELLASLGEDQVETRADAMYRIAEVQLAAEDSLEHGLDSLRRALSDNHKPERACKILQRAAEQHPSHEGLLDAYEQVARDSGDDAILLHYLERRANHETATADHVREAVTKARALDEGDRAEALMRRAVDVAREAGDSLYGVDWALLGLAERAKERGEIAEAVQWLEEAGEVADPEPLYRLSGEVAELAAQGGDSALAAKMYEKLRERDPTARGAWQPLVELYRELGDVNSLERVVRETLDGLQEVVDRNALRLSLAKALLGDTERVDDAISVLRDALFDEPGQDEALGLLTTSLETSGKTEELIELLRDQLIGAQDRGDTTTVKTASLRLGKMVETEEAVSIYRDALALGDDAELLETLLGVLGDEHELSERASLSERLLALKDGEEAADLAKQVTDLYAELDDAPGQLRCLELGLERAPSDLEIRNKLEQYYRDQGDHGGLARILEATARSTDDPAKKVELLKEAAAVHRDQLDDAAVAVGLLEQARELDPDNATLCVELATAKARSGDFAGGIETLNEVLESTDDPTTQVVLLRARASARVSEGNQSAAVEDLEEAYGVDPEGVADELLAALDEQRVAAADAANEEDERLASLRAIDVMMSHERRDEAIGLLSAWVDRMPDDLESMRQLRDLAADDQRWDEVERASLQLVDREEGEAQVASAAMLLEAANQLGNPESAREPLERVWGAQPTDARIRAEVRRLYELIGAHQELAKLLLEEAADLDDVEEKVSYLRWAGEALLSGGDVASALPALTEVLGIKPDDAQARCLLADANVLMGRFPEANELLDEAIAGSRRTSPDLWMFHHRKAYVAGSMGDHGAQLEALKKAHQHARKNGQVAAELADLAEALEEWDLAVATLRTISTLDEGESPITPAVALVRQGRIAMRNGDERRARLCARRASMTDPEAEGVQDLLAELGES